MCVVQAVMEILNDDCLLELFRFLDWRALIAADQVCTRFNYIAHILYRQYRHYEIHIRTECNLSDEILPRIGPHLDSLLFSSGYLMVPTKIIRNIVTNCSNLSRLKLQYITLGGQDLNLLEDLFGNLTELDLSCVRFDVPFEFTSLPKLKKLRLHFVQNTRDTFLTSLVENNPDLIIEKFPPFM